MNMQLNALHRLLSMRTAGVDKPQFYDAWNPQADPGMLLEPDQTHPALNDKNNFLPEYQMQDYFSRDRRMETSSLARLLGFV